MDDMEGGSEPSVTLTVPDAALLDAAGNLATADPALRLVLPRRRWAVATANGHHQLRSLLQTSSDGTALYFLRKRRPLNINNQYEWAPTNRVICKLDLRTGEVNEIQNTEKNTIHCFAVRYEFVAFCTGRSVHLLHEPTHTIIFEDFAPFLEPGSVSLTHVGDKFLMVIMCNRGKNPLYEISPDGNGGFKVHLFHLVECDYNLNCAAFGSGDMWRSVVCGADECNSPIFLEIQEDSSIKWLKEKCFDISVSMTAPNREGRVNLCSMSTAWWGDSSIGAIALDQGYCVVFDYKQQKTLAVIRNEANKTPWTVFTDKDQVRLVAFAPNMPVLVFAESHGVVHVVDLTTWQRQILHPPTLSKEPPPKEQPVMDQPLFIFPDQLQEPSNDEDSEMTDDLDPQRDYDFQEPAVLEYDGVMDPMWINGFDEVNAAVEFDRNGGAGLNNDAEGQRDLLMRLINMAGGNINDEERGVNGIAWRPDSRIFYVAYADCIQEYYLAFGVPSLKELCIDKIVGMRERWSELGWSSEQMPYQVTERL